MKNSFLIVLLFISSLTKAQHGNAIHKTNKPEDPWAIGITLSPEQTKLSSGPGPILGYTLGAQVGYLFTNNLWLTTGVSYSHKGFKQDYLTIAGKTNPDVGKSSTNDITTHINYFEIPLYLSYRTGRFNETFHKHKVVSSRKLGLVVSAGPVAGIVWAADFTRPGGTYNDHQIDNTLLKDAGYKNTLGLMGSIGAYYQINKDFFITLQPTYKFTFTNVPNTKNHHWSSIGLNLNIWYRLLELHPL